MSQFQSTISTVAALCSIFGVAAAGWKVTDSLREYEQQKTIIQTLEQKLQQQEEEPAEPTTVPEPAPLPVAAPPVAAAVPAAPALPAPPAPTPPPSVPVEKPAQSSVEATP